MASRKTKAWIYTNMHMYRCFFAGIFLRRKDHIKTKNIYKKCLLVGLNL